MNAHQERTIKAVLDALDDPDVFDGGLIDEPQLHGAVMQRTTPPAQIAEFDDALHYCASHKWITSQRGRLNKLRWAITDAGRVARRDM